jgi:hypothetical protein
MIVISCINTTLSVRKCDCFCQEMRLLLSRNAPLCQEKQVSVRKWKSTIAFAEWTRTFGMDPNFLCRHKSSCPFELASLAGGSPEKTHSSEGPFIERRDGGDPLSLSQQQKFISRRKARSNSYLPLAQERSMKTHSLEGFSIKIQDGGHPVSISRQGKLDCPEISVPILVPCDRPRTK